MINSDFLARAFGNIFLMEILFGKNLRQVELDGKIWMTIDKPDILRRLGSLRWEVGRCLAGKFIFTLENVWLDVGVGGMKVEQILLHKLLGKLASITDKLAKNLCEK